MATLVVGSIALDTIETPDEKREDVLGGSAMYFSIAASFFTQVNLVGIVGSDFPGDAIDLLHRHNVDTEGLQQVEGQTFRWSGRYHTDMNVRDTLDTQLNVFENFSPTIPEPYKKVDQLFLANIHPALQLDVLDQVNNPRIVITDTMNLWIDTTSDDLEKVIAKTDIFLLSDSEARQLTGEFNLLRAGNKLLEAGPSYIVIKKGEHGAMLVSHDGIFLAPGLPLENIVDPTGAGDVFAGGFVGHLDTGGRPDETTIRQAIIYGSVLASYNVEDFSLDRLKKLTREEIRSRFRAFKRLTDFQLDA